jgi:NAD(P)-dependent dehydrogenase (short-subunit alcohol dehydrogenase family)
MPRLLLASMLALRMSSSPSAYILREEIMRNRVAVVTGGTRGIGAAISKALRGGGYRVAAVYAANDSRAGAFRDETGIPVYRWDVADFDACQRGTRQVASDLGPIEILINNAGITRDGTLHKMAPAPLEGGNRDQSRRLLQHDAVSDRADA